MENYLALHTLSLLLALFTTTSADIGDVPVPDEELLLGVVDDVGGGVLVVCISAG